jgi:1,4-dihydroxy-2-naphthoyl-CoA synthase
MWQLGHVTFNKHFESIIRINQHDAAQRIACRRPKPRAKFILNEVHEVFKGLVLTQNDCFFRLVIFSCALERDLQRVTRENETKDFREPSTNLFTTFACSLEQVPV